MGEKKISICWKFSQVLLYLIAFACAVVASVTFGNAVVKFDGRCPLYTDGSDYLTFENVTHSMISGMDSASLWESKSTCDFSTFVPVAGATFGFILAYFVVMFDTAHIESGLERLHHNRMDGLFLPLLVSSFLLTIFMLVSSSRTLNGTKTFCNGVQNALDISCQEAQRFQWEGFPLVDNFYNLLLTSVITTWISSSAYILSIVLLLLRCFTGVDYAPITVASTKSAIGQLMAPRQRSSEDSQAQCPLLSPADTTPETPPPSEPLPGTSAGEPQHPGSR